MHACEAVRVYDSPSLVYILILLLCCLCREWMTTIQQCIDKVMITKQLCTCAYYGK